MNYNKHLLKITKGKNTASRPVLQNVKVEHGYMTATDSHRLLKVKGFDDTTNLVIDIENYNVSDLKYPETDRLIPNEGLDLQLSNHITKDIFDVLKVNKKEVIIIKSNSGTLEFVNSKTNLPILTIEVDNSFDFEIYVNGAYLTDCFDFMRDYNKENHNKIKLRVLSSVKPFMFFTDDFSYLLTPIRTQ